MEQSLSYSRRMGYARANKNQHKIPIKEQMKVVIVTPSIRIPRRILCSVEGGGYAFNRKPNSSDMSSVETFSQHSSYQHKK